MAESSPQQNGAAAITRRALGQYVRDISFESLSAQNGLAALGQQRVSIRTSVETHSRPADNQYEVITKLRVGSKLESSGDTLFLLEIDYVGFFEVSGLTDDQLRTYLHVECPRISFPFLRRIVADITQDAGFPQLILGTIDFDSIFRKDQASRAQSDLG